MRLSMWPVGSSGPPKSIVVKLILLGLLVNFTTGGFVLPLRWAGVLQRIGLCYLAAWTAKRWLGTRSQAILAAFLLLGYWAVMTRVVGPEGFAPNLEPQTNLSAQVDRSVLSGHLYRWLSASWQVGCSSSSLAFCGARQRRRGRFSR